MEKKRCGWCTDDPEYQDYHDHEWGRPIFDDQKLFELLILEGAQAGLSWITILKKREHYRKVFHGFNVEKVSRMSDDELEKLLQDPGIIRNRLKVFAARKNAKAFLSIKKEHKSFSEFLWRYVNNKPIDNRSKLSSDVPSSTELSGKIAKELKKRGFSFVGNTIIYAYMQSTGMVNDHQADCFCYLECQELGKAL